MRFISERVDGCMACGRRTISGSRLLEGRVRQRSPFRRVGHGQVLLPCTVCSVALKPEPLDQPANGAPVFSLSEIPEDRESSFERTAKRAADGPGEGFGPPFLFCFFLFGRQRKRRWKGVIVSHRDCPIRRIQGGLSCDPQLNRR